MKRILAIAVSLFSVVTGAFGQLVEPGTIWPKKNDFSATVEVAVIRTPDGYDFVYTVTNDLKSQQSIESFMILHSDSMLSPSSGVSNVRGYVPGTSLGKPGFQGGWKGRNITRRWAIGSSWRARANPEWGKLDFRSKMPRTVIKPGESENGFKLTNRRGPPKIARYFLEGWTPSPVLDEEKNRIVIEDQSRPVPVTQVIENADDFGDSIFKWALPNQKASENSVGGQTLGPAVPPTDQKVICDTFILDLIGQVREAVAAGWIKHDLRKDDDNRGKGKGDDKGVKKGQDDGDDHADDDVDMDNKDKNLPGVAKSIIKKLTKVRRECMRGKFGNAREKLRALIKQVNAQRGKHLTEEAYALIKFNAEFLLEKL